MERIKKLKDFSLNEDFSLSGLLSSVLPSLGQGFIKTLKQKIVGSLLDKFGILEDSTLSVLVQEFVDTIPVADIPKIITGDNVNVEYFAPKLAEFVQDTVQRKGLDTIAKGIGIDPTGWIYSTIRNTIQGQMGKEKLTKFFLEVLGGEDSVGQSALMDLDPKSKDSLNQIIRKKYSLKGSSQGEKNIKSGDGSKPSFWDSLLGGMVAGSKNIN